MDRTPHYSTVTHDLQELLTPWRLILATPLHNQDQVAGTQVWGSFPHTGLREGLQAETPPPECRAPPQSLDLKATPPQSQWHLRAGEGARDLWALGPAWVGWGRQRGRLPGSPREDKQQTLRPRKIPPGIPGPAGVTAF